MVESCRLILTDKNLTPEGMHMRFHFVIRIALLSASIAVAAADEIKPPPTKEGLWETHGTHTQEGKTVPDQSVKMCQSTGTTKAMQAQGEEMRKRNECTSHVTRSSPDTYVEESSCARGPNAGSVTKVIYTNEGDTASHTEMHMNVGKAETVVIIDAKYLGSCPAGMKPGDLMMEDGKIIPADR
jgi:hypothetical protein